MNVKEKLKDQKYAEAYSVFKLLEKIKKVAKKAGIQVIYVALLLFYTLQKTTTPKWAKTAIIGALGYFIFPVDFIPDVLPFLGFSDDVTVLVSALVAVALFVDEDSKAKAKVQLHVWFKDYDKSELSPIDDKINN